jgi:hypothetical protein
MSRTPTDVAKSAAAPAAASARAAAAVAPAAAGANAKRALAELHDPAQEARNLRQVLQDDKQRVGCFLGAGCPLGIYDESGATSLELIPAVMKLTQRVAEALGAAGADPKLAPWWAKVRDECRLPDGREPTVEDVLTEIRTVASRRGSSPVLGMSKDDLNTLDVEICRLITKEMRKSLPPHRSSYRRFASWIGGIHRPSPVEIFTPNYDVLFEQAFEQQQLPHFDGFVGSHEPWFDLSSIEHDVIPARWTRLWKLHGSINWERSTDAAGAASPRIVRVTGAADASRVLIYPSHLKYDQSRRMPYLAMLDRLRAFFRGDPVRRHAGLEPQRDDAPRMVICGYSFLDDHLNEVLLDGLRGNRRAHCFALMFSNLDDHPRAAAYAAKQGNLTVLARDGAVVGTRAGLYRKAPHSDEQHPWIYGDGPAGNESAAVQPKCRLGDFHYFGLFLEALCGGVDAVTDP